MGGQLRDNLEGEGVGVELLELIEISAGRYKQCFFFSIPSIKPNLVGTWCRVSWTPFSLDVSVFYTRRLNYVRRSEAPELDSCI